MLGPPFSFVALHALVQRWYMCATLRMALTGKSDSDWVSSLRDQSLHHPLALALVQWSHIKQPQPTGRWRHRCFGAEQRKRSCRACTSQQVPVFWLGMPLA